jgi:hypothetical protein
MAGLIGDDYSGIAGLGGAVEGFAKGLMQAEDMIDRREERRLKKMETEAKLRVEQADKQKKADEEKFRRAEGLRKEWMGNQTTKNSQTVKESYDKIRNAAPNAAGDISLVYNFMRINDPGSTVREGEFATAQNAAGIPDQIRNAYNRALTGERLSPGQRSQFVNQAGRLFQAQLESQKKFDEQFGGLADRYGVERGEVVLPIFVTDPQTGEQKVVQVPASEVQDPQQGLLAKKPGLVKKPSGLLPKTAKPKDDLESLSDEELERLYNAKMKGK